MGGNQSKVQDPAPVEPEIEEPPTSFVREDGKAPHYTQVIDPIETINPVSGRSVYYGVRPWRCDDRFQDWLGATLRFEGIDMMRTTWRTFKQCARSDFGEQPTGPYEVLKRKEVMFYVDRAEAGMLRDGLWEKYPYNARESSRVMMGDGLKMRVWRHQRELELEAKQGSVDELVAGSVWDQTQVRDPQSGPSAPPV